MLARARNHEDVAGVSIEERQVNRTLPLRFRQLRLFDRPDDADNREQLCVVRIGTLKDALTERAAVRPVTLREVFIHDTDPLGAMRIC